MDLPQRRSYTASDVTIAIPTYGREQVLLDTIRSCLEQVETAAEIIVVDQTKNHLQPTEQTLSEWNRAGKIRWELLENPSIPAAMNRALLVAKHPLVLFLDDDVIPAPNLVSAHAAAHDESISVIVGQVIQPWQQPTDLPHPSSSDDLRVDFDFPFHSTRRSEVRNVMALNMSVEREAAISAGGFDENFRGAAYRFETEFARRIGRHGGRIVFEPSATIRHLRSTSGGTRQHGVHLTSASPKHGVGDYYYAFREGSFSQTITYSLRRMAREVCTKFHLRHPWYIPIKLVGEVRAFLWAWTLHRAGASLIGRTNQ